MNYQKLLEISEDWLKYAIRLHLCHEDGENLVDSRKAALADSRIKRYLADITDFHGTLVTNHKNPDLPIHKLLFLIDLGFGTEVPEIQAAVDEILKHRDENGIYQSMTNVPKHFGGTGEDVFSWCLCDAPLRSLFSWVWLREHIQPVPTIWCHYAATTASPAPSPEREVSRSGRKDDCCPYATLIMADLLSYTGVWNSRAAVSAVKAC